MGKKTKTHEGLEQGPKHRREEVLAIRLVLATGRWPACDQHMFAMGVDGSVCGVDLVCLRVADVMLDGEPRTEITIDGPLLYRKGWCRVLNGCGLWFQDDCFGRHTRYRSDTSGRANCAL